MTRLAVEFRLSFFQDFLCHTALRTGIGASFCKRSPDLTDFFHGVRIVAHFTGLVAGDGGFSWRLFGFLSVDFMASSDGIIAHRLRRTAWLRRAGWRYENNGTRQKSRQDAGGTGSKESTEAAATANNRSLVAKEISSLGMTALKKKCGK